MNGSTPRDGLQLQRYTRAVRPFVLACAIVVSTLSAAQAQQSAVPPALIALDSAQGQQLLVESTARDDYFHLAEHFETQQAQSYCGVASSVMVLNALQVPAPSVPMWAPYRVFTQENLFNPDVRTFLPPDRVLHGGMTLDQLAHLLEANPARATVTYASDTAVGAFRETAARNLAEPGNFVIVNYQRNALAQEGYGHLSPLAAYHRGSDRFLILDVARYKYPPVWVPTVALFQAMNTADLASGHSRGYVVVSGAPRPVSRDVARVSSANPILRRVVLTLAGTFALGAAIGSGLTALLSRRRRAPRQ